MGPTREPATLRGRGSATNPANRFEKVAYERDPELPPDEQPLPTTQLLKDASRSALTSNDSPDVGFRFSLNPYRGCEHGCAYCYARPTHEYLGLSAGLDFETKILVKEDAPELLEKELASPRWEPQTIALSGVTDPYQPVERRLGLTRRCLEVLARARNPVAIVTKNELVTRDIDLLRELAKHGAASVFLSITTLDAELARVLEPRASAPERRLAALSALSSAGVPCGVMVAPVIPALTDHEMPAILAASAAHGARRAGYLVMRLPLAVAPLFLEWLDRHAPLRKKKVLARIDSLRGGRLNDPRFGTRMTGEGPYAEEMRQLFTVSCRKHGLNEEELTLSAEGFVRPRPAGPQLSLFQEPV